MNEETNENALQRAAGQMGYAARAATMLDEETIRAKVYKWIGCEPLQIPVDDLPSLVRNCDGYLREAAIFIGAMTYTRDYYAYHGKFPRARKIRPLRRIG